MAAASVAAAGIPTRDVGELLHISLQRASRLANAADNASPLGVNGRRELTSTVGPWKAADSVRRMAAAAAVQPPVGTIESLIPHESH